MPPKQKHAYRHTRADFGFGTPTRGDRPENVSSINSPPSPTRHIQQRALTDYGFASHTSGMQLSNSPVKVDNGTVNDLLALNAGCSRRITYWTDGSASSVSVVEGAATSSIYGGVR